MAERAPITPDELLAHSGFVRSLARGLLSDEALVEDVVQETWVRALTNGPRQKEALVTWLRTVTRNLSFKAQRSRARRNAREHAAAREERLPGTLDLVARQDALQGVVDAVSGLPEIYREAVLLRYFENLPPREIAVRLDLPVSTVRMRLHRGLQHLRGALDREHDGRRGAWTGPLALLTGLRAPEPELATAPGVGLGSSTVLASLAGILTVLAGLFLWTRDEGPRRGPEGLAPTELEVTGLDPRTDRGPDAVGERLTAPGTPATLAAQPVDPEAAWRLTGRVLDGQGRPVAGATLLLDMGKRPAHARGTSAADGSYSITLTEDLREAWVANPVTLLLAAQHPEHAPSVLEPVSLGSPGTLVLRGPGTTWSGRVTTPSGQPVAGAWVRVGERARLGFGHLTAIVDRDTGRPDRSRLWPSKSLDRVAHRRLQAYALARGYMGQGVLDAEGQLGSLPPAQEVVSGPDGAFELRGLGPGVQRVQVDASGWQPLEFELDLAPGRFQRDVVVLPGVRLYGTVQRVDGAALRRAHVHAIGRGREGVHSTPVDAQGNYVLRGLPPGDYELFADTEEAGRPALSARWRTTLGEARAVRWDALLAPGATLEGRLLDADGQPLAGWNLALLMEDRPPIPVDQVLTDARGGFRMDAVPPVRWRLEGSPPEDGAPMSLELARGEGPGTEPLELVVSLRGGMAHLSGRITDSSDRLLERFHPILVVRADGRRAVSANLQEDGSFRTGALPPGTYQLFVPDGSLGVFLPGTVELVDGDLDLGTLSLPPTVELELPRPPGARALERVLVQRSLPGSAEPVVLFAGQAELPLTLDVQAGDVRVTYPDLPGGVLHLDLVAR